MSTLIMAAPNGARKTKADHPNLPITVDEVVAEARACREARAAMLHAHVGTGMGHMFLITAFTGSFLTP